MKVESIVCPVTMDLDVYGKISNELFNLAQKSLRNDLCEIGSNSLNSRLLLGQAISINCKPEYKLGNFKTLIFVALWDYQSEYSFNLFYKAYINSLRQAFQHNIRSIALPIMAYEGNLNLCGQAILKSVHDLDGLKHSAEFSIEEIYFVSKNRRHINFMEKEVSPKLY